MRPSDRDFKTAACRIGEGDVDVEQLNLYAIAVRKTGLREQIGLPLVLRVNVALKTKAAEIIPLTITPDGQ